MSNVHIHFKPEKNDDGRNHALSLFQDEETGVVEVAHIVDGRIEGEPFQFTGLSPLFLIMADAMVCNFDSFRRIDVTLELVSSNDNID